LNESDPERPVFPAPDGMHSAGAASVAIASSPLWRLVSFLKTAWWVGAVVLARTAAVCLRPASGDCRKRWSATVKNLAVWLRVRSGARVAELLNHYFDEGYYLETNPNIGSARLRPFVHYLLQGYLEGRNPSPDFDTRYYLACYQDVAESGLNPLLHYVSFGRSEGRYAAPDVTGAPSSAWEDDLPWADGETVAVDNRWPASDPLVSVVIICFNYGRFLEEALQSVLAQTFQDFEVVVVEGGSTDGSTRQQVLQLESQAPPRVRFIYRAEPHLVGDNRNAGIAAARGRYICCLDADDMLRPTYLEAAVFLAEAHGYDIVYPAVRCFGASDLVWRVVDASLPGILRENQIPTVALFRKSWWERVGGFRDWGLGPEHVPEDWDLWVRLLGLGAVPKSIREPLMMYRVHETSLTANCRIGTTVQLAQIRQANAELLARPAPARQRRKVLNPWVNLYRAASAEAKPAILFAMPFVTVGGAETLLATLAQGFAAEGYQIVLTTTLPLPPSMRDHKEVFEPVTSCIYDLPALFDGPGRWKDFFWYLLETKNIQLILLAGSEYVYHLLPELRARFPQVRVMDQLFNDAVHVYNNRRYAEFIDRTIVPSADLATSLAQNRGASAASVRVIGHGIDIQASLPCLPPTGRVAPPPPPKQEGQFIVSFFGRFSSEKAPRTFVEIANRLKRDPGIRFYMTGEGPERAAVLKLIERRRLTDRIYAPGFVPDVRPLIEQSDVVVLPSTIDGMPLVVLEAQTLGKPVVASRVGSLAAMVADGVTGFLCDPGDIDMFCERIRRLRQQAELRREMGERARIHAAAAFGADRMLAEYRTAIRELGGTAAVAGER